MLIFSYVSIGDHACKQSSSNMSSTQAITTSNMFSILTNSITESIKKDTLSIDVASNQTHKSDRLHVDSAPSSVTKGTVIDKLSPGSYEFAPDFFGHYSPRYLYKLTLAV